MLRTGVIARLRLWRTLRAARIFASRGQMAEALQRWRLATQIDPGCVPALTAVAAFDALARLDRLETVTPPEPAPVGPLELVDLLRNIDAAYERHLGRHAWAPEAEGYLRHLVNGGSLEECVAVIANSEEARRCARRA